MQDRELKAAASSIDRLRRFRVRPTPDRHAGGMIDAVRDELGRRVRSTAGIVDAWRAVVPDELADRTVVGGFRRSVLTIETPDATTRYLVQRWLRGGGQHMLAGCAPGTIRKVIVKIVAPTG